MKLTVAMAALFLLTGCVTNPSITKEQLYYEAAKSISRDSAMAQAACWAAISEIAKTGDSTAKVGALALADKCKNQPVQLESPKRNFLGL